MSFRVLPNAAPARCGHYNAPRASGRRSRRTSSNSRDCQSPLGMKKPMCYDIAREMPLLSSPGRGQLGDDRPTVRRFLGACSRAGLPALQPSPADSGPRRSPPEGNGRAVVRRACRWPAASAVASCARVVGEFGALAVRGRRRRSSPCSRRRGRGSSNDWPGRRKASTASRSAAAAAVLRASFVLGRS